MSCWRRYDDSIEKSSGSVVPAGEYGSELLSFRVGQAQHYEGALDSRYYPGVRRSNDRLGQSAPCVHTRHTSYDFQRRTLLRHISAAATRRADSNDPDWRPPVVDPVEARAPTFRMHPLGEKGIPQPELSGPRHVLSKGSAAARGFRSAAC